MLSDEIKKEINKLDKNKDNPLLNIDIILGQEIAYKELLPKIQQQEKLMKEMYERLSLIYRTECSVCYRQKECEKLKNISVCESLQEINKILQKYKQLMEAKDD